MKSLPEDFTDDENDKKKFSDIRILEYKGICRILLYLLEHPEGTQKVDFRHKLKLASTTAIGAQQVLSETHLIKTVIDDNRILHKLTDAGKRMACLLKEISVLLTKNQITERLTTYSDASEIECVDNHQMAEFFLNLPKKINDLEAKLRCLEKQGGTP